MARKRLNKKFLILLAIPFVLCGGAVAAYMTIPQVKWLYRGTPTKHAAEAKQLYDQGNYAAAAEKYKRAIQLKGSSDAEYYTALGDCYYHLVLKQPENLRVAKLFWDRALSIDPRYLPVLQRLLDLYIEDCEMNRSSPAQQWEAVRAAAAKVLALDPKDRKARTAMNRAVVQRWLSGVEVDPQQLTDATAALLQLADESPFDADAMFYALQSKVAQGQRRRAHENDPAGANAIYADVLKIIDDALAAHPEDAKVHFRASQSLRFLGASVRDPGQPPKYLDRLRSEAEKAVALAKPDDPLYLDMKLYLAKVLDAAGEMPAVEKIYRSLLAEQPDEMSVHIVLAELLARDPAHRSEAISLLTNLPQQSEKNSAGFRGLIVERYEMTALANLVNIKLDSLPNSKDQQEYDAMLKQIDDDYRKLTSRPGVADSTTALQIMGRVQLARGQYLQAVQTLDRAYKLLPPPNTIVDLDQRYKLMLSLAGAYTLTEQTGEAKALLAQVVRDFDKYAPARLMLAQLLLRENNVEEARKHLDVLAKSMPDSPTVVRLMMLALDKDKDKDKLDALYKKLPEGTRNESISKAQMAERIGRREETLRLLEGIRSISPNDMDALVSLAKLYAEMGDKSKAIGLIDEAIAKNPESPELKMLAAQISGGDVGEISRETIQREKDPFRKELLEFDLAVQESREADALKHLEAATKINPNDGRIQALLFQIALQQKDWTAAQGYLESLAKKNQDLADGLLFRVRLAMAKGELKEASDLAQKLTQTKPQFAQSWVLLGQVQKAMGQYSEAIQNFQIALDKQPQNLDAIRGMIDSYYAINDTNSVRRMITVGRKIFPRNIVLREMDLQYELTYGDPEKAIAPRQEILKTAIEKKDPGEPKYWLDLGNAYLTAARKKDSDQQGRPMLDKARDTFAQAIAKFPDDLLLVRGYADTSLQVRDFNSGLKALQALVVRPNWKSQPEPAIMLAEFYGLAGKTAEQEKVLRDFLVLSPQSVPVEIALANILAGQNKLDDALKLLENTDNAEIRKQRIQLQIEGGRFADAEKEIQSALASTATPSPELITRQAFVYMRSGRVSEAKQLIDKVLSENPNNVEAIFYRGTIYVGAQANLEQAIRDLQTVRDAAPNLIDARLLLAQAYHLRNEDTAAMRELEEAIRRAPTAKTPRLRLLDLYSSTSPPSWGQVERVIRDSRAQPQLAKDPDIYSAEIRMWLKRKDPAKAKTVATDALGALSNNTTIFHLYCETLLQNKEYQPLLAVTDKLVRDKKAQWWIYQYRGQAKKGAGDKQGALEEFGAGIDVAMAAKDEAAAATLVETAVRELGVASVKGRVYALAEKGENRWRIMMSSVLRLDGDLPGAVTWINKVIDDPKTPPDEADMAQHFASQLYMSMDPPETAKAVTALRAVLDRHPKDIAAINNLACAMILPKSGYTPKQALEYSTRAFTQLEAERPGFVDPNIYDTQGYMLVLVGRPQEGIGLLQQSVDKKPIPEACYHLGEAYMSLPTPQPAEAEKSYQQALALLDSAAREDQPLDAELKTKIQMALQKVPKTAPTTNQIK